MTEPKIALDDYGISLTYHHHMGTVVQTAQETDKFLAKTDAKYVNLLFDSGHFKYCDEDPILLIKKYIDRIKHVHLKDIRPDIVKKVKKEDWSFLKGVREGAFTVPGDGCIDFTDIFKTLEKHNYNGYMLVEAEQDPSVANPLEYAIKARNYIKEIAGI